MTNKSEYLESIIPKSIPEKVYFRMAEVSRMIGVEPHVLRYWEQEFSCVAPEKSMHNQRLYRRKDVENLFLVKHLLYHERFSIEGAKKRIFALKRGDLPVAEFMEHEKKSGLSPSQKNHILSRMEDLKRALAKGKDLF